MEHLNRNEIWGGMKWDRLTESRLENNLCLERYGYKVYSQNDEDGIIDEIFNRIGTTNKTFIEFGVENGLECNSHLLLFSNWNGLWIDGSEENCREISIKFRNLIAAGTLKLENSFITKDNINNLIKKHHLQGEIDLLSIDIDGNDYYIWEKIEAVNPRVVIIEYNGKFPPNIEWKMAYNENHIWDGSDWHGASLKAYEVLGSQLGYQLVGTNISGTNAFFVRKDLAANKFYLPPTAEQLYNPARFNMFFKCGHPAKFCLFNQADDLGYFNYYPEFKVYPNYGYHSEEKWEKDKTIRWISSKQSCVLINNTGGGNHTELSFDYYNPIIEGKLKEKIVLDLQINGVFTKQEIITEDKGNISITIPSKVRNQAVYRLEIGISHLWRPMDYIGNDDSRELGIAIDFNSFQLNN